MYFDYTSTTKIDDEILKLLVKVESDFYGNTEALHYLGQRSNNLLEKAKNEISDILKVNHEIIFTHNATEANNLGIQGVVSGKKGKVITTKIEHPSVFEVFKALEKQGYEVVYLNVNSDGVIDLKELENEMNKDVLLVSCMWVNNITGSIQPIKKVIDIVSKYPKAKLHVDAVQGMCKIVPDFSFNEIDLMTISAHKFYGPKGVGALMYKKNIILEKTIYGSNVQNGIKPGTIDLGKAVCLCKAIKKYYPTTKDRYDFTIKLCNKLRENIKNVSCIKINSNNYNSPYIFNISFDGINGETILHRLEEKEIYVSTGSSCSSKIKKPEKTIYECFKDENRALSSIRISLSHHTTEEEIDALINAIKEIV